MYQRLSCGEVKGYNLTAYKISRVAVKDTTSINISTKPIIRMTWYVALPQVTQVSDCAHVFAWNAEHCQQSAPLWYSFFLKIEITLLFEFSEQCAIVISLVYFYHYFETETSKLPQNKLIMSNLQFKPNVEHSMHYLYPVCTHMSWSGLKIWTHVQKLSSQTYERIPAAKLYAVGTLIFTFMWCMTHRRIIHYFRCLLLHQCACILSQAWNRKCPWLIAYTVNK